MSPGKVPPRMAANTLAPLEKAILVVCFAVAFLLLLASL